MRHYLLLSAAILLAACGSTPTTEVSPAAVTVGAANTTPAPAAMRKKIKGSAKRGAKHRLPGRMKGMLKAHNRVRKQHNLPPLKWSKKLANYSKEWSNHLALNNACNMKHRSDAGQDKAGYGENLFWAGALSWSDGAKEVQKISAPEVAEAWANEQADYNYQNNSCRPGKQCGHYTQMVWKSTKRVGCAATMCPDKGQMWVCSYNPAGNWVGKKPY